MSVLPPFERHVATRRIFAEEAEKAGTTVEQIKGHSRKAHIVAARWAVIDRLRNDLHMSLTQIGKAVNRDHSSVIHALEQLGARKLPQPYAKTARGWHLRFVGRAPQWPHQS